MNIYLTNERYLAALQRIREQIQNGLELDYEDSDDIGNKYTYNTWGLCSDKIEQWPDKEDRIRKLGKLVHTKYRITGQHCPFDRDQNKGTSPAGCFYRCRFFSPEGPIPNREQALELYDITIGVSK